MDKKTDKMRPTDVIGSSNNKQNKPKDGKKTKGKSRALYFWSSEDVNKWMRKHCGPFHGWYGDQFLNHEINGRTLIRLTEGKLEKMGITNPIHREELMRHILRLKLKTEAQELKTLDQKGASSV